MNIVYLIVIISGIIFEFNNIFEMKRFNDNDDKFSLSGGVYFTSYFLYMLNTIPFIADWNLPLAFVLIAPLILLGETKPKGKELFENNYYQRIVSIIIVILLIISFFKRYYISLS